MDRQTDTRDQCTFRIEYDSNAKYNQVTDPTKWPHPFLPVSGPWWKGHCCLYATAAYCQCWYRVHQKMVHMLNSVLKCLHMSSTVFKCCLMSGVLSSKCHMQVGRVALVLSLMSYYCPHRCIIPTLSFYSNIFAFSVFSDTAATSCISEVIWILVEYASTFFGKLITSAKEVMFSLLFVCLSVCLLTTLRNNL